MRFFIKTFLLALLLTTFSLCRFACAIAAENDHSCCPGEQKKKESSRQCCSIVSYISKSDAGAGNEPTVVPPLLPVLAQIFSPVISLEQPQLPAAPQIDRAARRDLIVSLSRSPNAPPAA